MEHKIWIVADKKTGTQYLAFKNRDLARKSAKVNIRGIHWGLTNRKDW